MNFFSLGIFFFSISHDRQFRFDSYIQVKVVAEKNMKCHLNLQHRLVFDILFRFNTHEEGQVLYQS